MTGPAKRTTPKADPDDVRAEAATETATETAEPGDRSPAAPTAETTGRGRAQLAAISVGPLTFQLREPVHPVTEARRILPSKGARWHYGALAASGLLGIIEWPAAVAIGIGTALAGKGETRFYTEHRSGSA